MADPNSSVQSATLHDVAARVGVSTRTVSRVVNGEGGFSDATEARVKAAIDELGYRPNLLARGLITKRTNTIGLVGGSMLDPFFPELAEGVEQAGQELGLTLFFAATSEDRERQERVLDSLVSRGVDGIIVFPVNGDPAPIRKLRNVPVVVINPATQDPTISSVSSDIVGGAMLAVEHLQGQGRRQIVFLGNASPHSSQREQGYSHALRGESLRIHNIEPTAEAAMAGIDAMIERWPDVDALFTYNDVMAMAAIRRLQALGRTVPDDVAVVGFDNIGLSAYTNPPLTTIDLQQTTVGRTAVAMLNDLMNDPSQPVQHTLQGVELVVRESSIRHETNTTHGHVDSDSNRNGSCGPVQ